MPKKTKPLAFKDIPNALRKDRQRVADEMLRLYEDETTKAQFEAVLRESKKLTAEVKKLIKKEEERQKGPKKRGKR
jgi:hypothetical protein